MSADAQGVCPMGCGHTLFLGSGGYVTCSWVDCPRPSAVSDILEDQETQHVVKLGERTFTVRHPLRERLDDALMTCDLHERIAQLPKAPQKPGTYRVTVTGDGSWAWLEIQA